MGTNFDDDTFVGGAEVRGLLLLSLFSLLLVIGGRGRGRVGGGALLLVLVSIGVVDGVEDRLGSWSRLRLRLLSSSSEDWGRSSTAAGVRRLLGGACAVDTSALVSSVVKSIGVWRVAVANDVVADAILILLLLLPVDEADW